MVEWSKKRPVLGGIVMVVLLWVLYVMSTVLRNGADEASRYWIDSLLRCAFGVWGIRLFARVFYDGDWRQVIHLNGFGKGLAAGWGLLAMAAIMTLRNILYGEGFVWGLSLVIGRAVMQQIGTGLFEEITFRALFLEGGMRRYGGSWLGRFVLMLCNAAAFTALHISNIRGNPVTAIGYLVLSCAFAAVYLYSGNILACMVLHTVYDIPANLNKGFTEVTEVFQQVRPIWSGVDIAILGLMLVTSVVLVLRAKPRVMEISETEQELSDITE